MGEQERSLRLLRDVVRQVPACPEVLLALARRTRDGALLRTALSLAPELALDAAAMDVAGVDAVCRGLLRELEPRCREVQAIHAGARDAVRDERLPALPEPPPPHRDPALRLAVLGAWAQVAVPGLKILLQTTGQTLEQAMAANRSDAETASAEIRQEEAQARCARNEIGEPVRLGGTAAAAAAGTYLGYLLFTWADGTNGGLATLGLLAALGLGGVTLVYGLRTLPAILRAVEAADSVSRADTSRTAAEHRRGTLDQLHDTWQRERTALQVPIRRAQQLPDLGTRVRPFTARA